MIKRMNQSRGSFVADSCGLKESLDGVEMPHGKGPFLGTVRPLKSIESLLQCT